MEANDIYEGSMSAAITVVEGFGMSAYIPKSSAWAFASDPPEMVSAIGIKEQIACCSAWIDWLRKGLLPSLTWR